MGSFTIAQVTSIVVIVAGAVVYAKLKPAAGGGAWGVPRRGRVSVNGEAVNGDREALKGDAHVNEAEAVPAPTSSSDSATSTSRSGGVCWP